MKLLKKTDNKGAVAIEFALIIPVLILLLFGVVEFGRMMWIKSSLQFTVDETARYVLTHQSLDEDDVIAYAEANVFGMAPDTIEFDAYSEDESGVTFMTITAVDTFEPLIDMLSIGTINLEGKTRVPISE